MPFRSPKMYFCIFGFHRLVWWPKCTPASSNSFIVSAAMCPPRFASAAFRAPSRAPTEDVRRAWFDPSRRVLGVDPDVLLAEIARPHRVLAPSEAEVDRDRVLGSSHDLAKTLDAHAGAHHAPIDEAFVLERDADARGVDPRARLA